MACATLKRSYYQMMDCSPSSSPKNDASHNLFQAPMETSLYHKRLCCGISSLGNMPDSSPLSTVSLSQSAHEGNLPLSGSPPLDSTSSHSEPSEHCKTPLCSQPKRELSPKLKVRFLEEVKRLERRGNIFHAKAILGARPSVGSTAVIESPLGKAQQPQHLPSSSVASEEIGSSSSVVSPSRSQDPDHLLTLSQAYQLCNRIWRDREAHLRQDYEQLLLDRLTEQYEAFAQQVDALLRSRTTAMPPPSYVS